MTCHLVGLEAERSILLHCSSARGATWAFDTEAACTASLIARSQALRTSDRILS